MCCDVSKPVQKSVAQLIATVAKHDLPAGRWPTLFQFLNQCVHSDSTTQREVRSVFTAAVHFADASCRKQQKWAWSGVVFATRKLRQSKVEKLHPWVFCVLLACIIMLDPLSLD